MKRIRDPKHCWENKMLQPTLENSWTVSLKDNQRDFPGGPVVKNLPASVGDTGSIPGPKGSHVQQLSLCATLLGLCSRAHELQLLSLCATTTKAAHAPRTCAPQETPPRREACVLQQTVATTRCNWRKACLATKNLCGQK